MAGGVGAGRFARRVTSARSRYSMRLRVFVAVTAAALTPHLLVVAWSQIERPVAGRAWTDVRDATEAAAKALAAEPRGLAGATDALNRIARDKRVWLRAVGPGGRLAFDANHDDPLDALQPIDAFFFGADTLPPGAVEDALGPLAERPEVDAAALTGRFVRCGDEAGALVCQATRRVGDLPGENVVVHAQKSSARAVQAVYLLRHQLLRLSFITLPLALALALYAASRVIRPIERLRGQALARAHEARPEAELVGQDDEVGDLADAFNAMLGALESRRAQNEAFIADLVHEMKSPVAAVRAAAEALERGAPDGERSARLSRVLNESARKLDRLVTDFLELARAEAGIPDEETARIDLGELVEALAREVREDERYAGLEVTIERRPAGAPATIDGIQHRIEACLRELLENAASYAGPGGRVAARVDTGDGEVTVTVEDSGPGIAPEDLPKVFRRFYTTRGEVRGTGLGLALVRAVVEAHGGRVAARNAPAGGAIFEVKIRGTPG